MAAETTPQADNITPPGMAPVRAAKISTANSMSPKPAPKGIVMNRQNNSEVKTASIVFDVFILYCFAVRELVSNLYHVILDDLRVNLVPALEVVCLRHLVEENIKVSDCAGVIHSDSQVGFGCH